jgi:predicted hotdog family 3-hydroxylacyl-ACP dehydratase
MKDFPSLEELLPHRPPMVLIDEIVDFDEEDKVLVAAFTVRSEWKHNLSAIEYMAQTSAALAGMSDLLERPGEPARPGFLLGTRRMVLNIAEFEVGRRYTVKSTLAFSDYEAASFDCAIYCDCEEVASATLNAYRPSDIGSFLVENRR